MVGSIIMSFYHIVTNLYPPDILASDLRIVPKYVNFSRPLLDKWIELTICPPEAF